MESLTSSNFQYDPWSKNETLSSKMLGVDCQLSMFKNFINKHCNEYVECVQELVQIEKVWKANSNVVECRGLYQIVIL